MFKHEMDWVFYERKIPSSTSLTLEGGRCFPPLILRQFELIQSCQSSTGEMSEQKVSVSVEQSITNKFVTAEGVQTSEIIQRFEKTVWRSKSVQNSSVQMV